LTELVVPSPKFQRNAYGGTPPEAVPVNVIVWPVVGFEGVKLNPADNGGGAGGDTVTVCVTVVVCGLGDAESVTVSVIVKVPAA
jgi:hypothetical protein